MRDFQEDIEFLFSEEIKNNDDFCIDLWCALANVDWFNEDGAEFGCSFRYAGGLIADIRENGTYMDWYCSGEYPRVSMKIEAPLLKLGWGYRM